MTTMTLPKKSKTKLQQPPLPLASDVPPAKAETKPDPQLDTTKLTDLQQLLTQEYVEVQVKINWFSTSAQIADVLKQQMVNPVRANRNAVRLSKALFNSKHPSVQKVNAAKRAIESLRDAYSHAMPELPVAGSTFKTEKDAKQGAEELTKRAGCRLIPMSLVDEFHAQCQVLIDNLYRAADEMDRDLESIKQADAEDLKDLYDERDYPKSVRDLIKVRGPSYRQIGLSTNFAQACPKAWSKLQAQISSEYVDCFRLATADFAATLVELTETVTRQLGNRTRLAPTPDHPLRVELFNAEVLDEARSSDTEDVIPGQVMVQVRLTKDGRKLYLQRKKSEGQPVETGDKDKNEPVWYGPFTEEVYKTQLRPFVTEDKRALHDSSVTQLLGHLEHFRRVGDLFSAGGETNLQQAVTDLEEVLRSSGSKEGLVRELRTSTGLRSTLAKSLKKVTDFVKGNVTETSGVKKRRRITVISGGEE